MKSRTAGRVRSAREQLIFAWNQKERTFTRFWFAGLLAVGLVLIFGSAFRFVIPTSVAPNSPRVGKVQLVVIDENSAPSLQALVSESRLPSLASGYSVGEAPMIDEMLSLLGLAESLEEEFPLYPAPDLRAELIWPEKTRRQLSLPPLPSLDEALWPRAHAQESESWFVRIRGEGRLAPLIKEKDFPWDHPLPLERHWQWSLAFDRAGRLAFALPVRDYDTEAGILLRRILEQCFQAQAVENSAAGLVEVTFVRREE